MNITVSSNGRLGIMGVTGSGKTYLARELLTGFKRVIAVDRKKTLTIPGFVVTKYEDAALRLPRVIYRPDGDIEDGFWRRILKRYGAKRKPNTVLYLDEAALITNPGFIPPSLKEIVITGREIGLGVVWGAQRPSIINNTLLDQSEMLIAFKLPGPADREKLVGYMGEMAHITRTLGEYEFVVYGKRRLEGVETEDGVEASVMSLEAD